ncbi:MAG: ABC transporter permease subunit [bacterium]|nr:ABC transporter permease subunit [bacterium]
MRRELRQYAIFALGFFVVLEAMLAIAIRWWPSFAENVGSLKNLSRPIPMLTEMIDLIEARGVGAYVAAQHFFKGCNTLGVAAAVLFAYSAIAGEAHRGTMEQWLARPVSRTRLLTERYLLGFAACALPILLTSATAPFLLARVEIEGVAQTMELSDLMRGAVHESLFLGTIYSLTFLLSAVGSEPLKIAFIMMFASIFEFAIYMVETITHYSVFRLADIETFDQINVSDALSMRAILGFVVFSIVCYLVALRAFARRVP